MASVTASDPPNFIVTLVTKVALAPRGQEQEALNQTGGPRILQWPLTREHTRCTPLAGLCIHVTVGGGVWNVWSKEMKTRVSGLQLPRTSANTLSAIIQCHVSPYFPVTLHLSFLLNFILNFQAFS